MAGGPGGGGDTIGGGGGDVQDPRFRRWLEANNGPIEEVD